MTVPKDTESAILRLHFAEKWRIGTIASHLHVHHSTVRRVLVRSGVSHAAQQQRKSRLDPYLDFIDETFRKYPRLHASALYGMCRERGYTGQPDHFRHMVNLRRPRPAVEAFARLRTLPGEQAQVDWAHFGTIQIGQAVRPLVAFIMVLSWSRHLFVQFDIAHRMENFLRGHEAAFQYFAGIPRVCLYDNLKSAVLERQGDAIRFNPVLLDFAGHHRYEARPVAPYRGNEKARVERAIGHVRTAFFPARQWKDLDDLNAQALTWCQGAAADRPCPEDRTLSVRQAWEREKGTLRPLPETSYPTDERVIAHAGKTPYVRFDLNDYSIPHHGVRKTLEVIASSHTVRIQDGKDVIATHTRSYDKAQQIEDPAHIEALVAWKRNAREHRGIDRLRHAVPQAHALLKRLAERGTNLGASTSALLRLLDTYGAHELEAAVAEAMTHDSPHPHSVRLILERRCHEQGAPPPIAITLPDNPKVRDMAVVPHDLADYDRKEARRDSDD
jgi:transposase/phosphoglycolate phosphatase-like HAD superfamily hydrolase